MGDVKEEKMGKQESRLPENDFCFSFYTQKKKKKLKIKERKKNYRKRHEQQEIYSK